jgi:hypothetical protein
VEVEYPPGSALIFIIVIDNDIMGPKKIFAAASECGFCGSSS